MAIRIHVIAANAATATDLDAALARARVAARPARTAGAWAFATAELFGNRQSAIDSALLGLEASSFRATSVDGVEWHLSAFARGRRIGTWKRKFASGNTESEARELVDGLQEAGFPFDRSTLLASLTGPLDPTNPRSDLGDLPAFLGRLGLPGAFEPDGGQADEAGPALAPAPARSPAHPVAELLGLFREADLEPLEGGPFTVPIAALPSVVRHAADAADRAQVAVKVSLAPPFRLDLESALLEPAIVQRGASRVTIGLTEMVDVATLVAWADRLASPLSGVPTGSAIELFVAVETTNGEAAAAAVCLGQVAPNGWTISDGWSADGRRPIGPETPSA